MELSQFLHGKVVGSLESDEVRREICRVQPELVLQEAGGHVLEVGGDTGEDTASVHTAEDTLTHPDGGQVSILY